MRILFALRQFLVGKKYFFFYTGKMRAVCTLLILMIISAPSYSQGFTIKTIGQAGPDLVSNRDVEIHTILAQVLFQYQPKKVFNYPLSDKELGAELSNFLLEKIVYFEAKSLSVMEVSSEKITDQEKLFYQKIAISTAFDYWKSLAVDSSELREHLDLKNRVRGFVGLKRDSTEKLVTDAEVKEHYVRSQSRFVAGSFEAHKKDLRKELVERQGEERLREWFQVLKQKYKVNVF